MDERKENMELSAKKSWLRAVACVGVAASLFISVLAQAASVCSGSSTTLHAGTYQLTGPAMAAIAKTNDLAYFAEQQDVDAGGNTAYAGHLYANRLSATASVSSPAVWDAAALMTVPDRQVKLYTQGADGHFLLLSTAQSNLNLLPSTIAAQMQVNGSNAIAALINPDYQGGAWLAGRSASSLMGRPMYAQPILAGQAVVVGSEDGFLYGFDKTTGALLWGFIPAELLPSTQTPGALIGANPWGQARYSLYAGNNYLMATAMQGAIHMAFTLNADGTLASIAWKDYEQGQTSPTMPVGGAAPTVALDQTGSAAGKAAYIYGMTLKRVSIVDGSNPQLFTICACGGSPTSNLVYINDSAAYYGTSTGNVEGAFGIVAPGQLLGPSTPVLYVTGAYLPGYTDGRFMLVGASTTRAKTFYPVGNSVTGGWQFSATSSTGVPVLPSGATITSIPTISGGLIYFGLTDSSTLCTQQAYEVGPLSLLTGQPVLTGSLFRNSSLGSSMQLLGAGVAFFAPETVFNGQSFVMADSNGGGSNTTASGFGAYSEKILDWGNRNIRNDWRELTSFIVGWLKMPWKSFGGHSPEGESGNDGLA